ncbi:MAG: hypothetical protein EB116_17265, partial [Betaproteobacteria bacterium]|nr:hypothetical protein [Betaproteobacteria bacterium]
MARPKRKQDRGVSTDSSALSIELASRLYRQGRFADALKMCSRLAIGQPFVSTVQVIEALSLIGLNRWSEGENALLQALALNPDDFDALANLGVLRSRQGKLVEAIQLLERVVRGRGLAHDVQNLANFYIDSGQISAAERALDAAIARKASS